MFCGGQVLTDADVAAPAIAAIQRIGDPPLDLEVIDLEVGVASDSGLHFRFLNNSWNYFLSTAALISGTYELTIEMPDGLRYVTGFILK